MFKNISSSDLRKNICSKQLLENQVAGVAHALDDGFRIGAGEAALLVDGELHDQLQPAHGLQELGGHAGEVVLLGHVKIGLGAARAFVDPYGQLLHGAGTPLRLGMAQFA